MRNAQYAITIKHESNEQDMDNERYFNDYCKMRKRFRICRYL